MNLFTLISVLFAYSWGSTPAQVSKVFGGLSVSDEKTLCRSRNEREIPIEECFHFDDKKTLFMVSWKAHLVGNTEYQMKSYDRMRLNLSSENNAYPNRESQKNPTATDIAYRETRWSVKTPISFFVWR